VPQAPAAVAPRLVDVGLRVPQAPTAVGLRLGDVSCWRHPAGQVEERSAAGPGGEAIVVVLLRARLDAGVHAAHADRLT
jgi:hypothetical protein